MERVLAPEWLDELPPEDRAAQKSRADLRRLNRLMDHAGMITRALRYHPSIRRITDLGSGDATLLLRVARQLRWRDVHLTIIDRQPAVTGETEDAFGELGWKLTVEAADVFAALTNAPRSNAITANLFLHHFPAEKLREMLALVAERTPLFIACEPRRAPLSLAASRCIGLIGCGRVTRHDAVVSVRAGFTGSELTELWPERDRWQIEETPHGLFSHFFSAKRS